MSLKYHVITIQYEAMCCCKLVNLPSRQISYITFLVKYSDSYSLVELEQAWVDVFHLINLIKLHNVLFYITLM